MRVRRMETPQALGRVNVCMFETKRHAELWTAVCAKTEPKSQGGGEVLAGAAGFMLFWVGGSTVIMYTVADVFGFVLLVLGVPVFFGSVLTLGTVKGLKSMIAEDKDLEKTSVLRATSTNDMEDLALEEIAKQWQRVWGRVYASVEDEPRRVDWVALGKLIAVSESDLKTFFKAVL